MYIALSLTKTSLDGTMQQTGLRRRLQCTTTSRAEDTPWRGQTPGRDVDLSPILQGKNRLRGSSAVLFYNSVLVIARHERSEPLRLIELAISERGKIFRSPCIWSAKRVLR